MSKYLTLAFVLLLQGCSNTSVFVPLEGPIGIQVETRDDPPPVIVNQHPD